MPFKIKPFKSDSYVLSPTLRLYRWQQPVERLLPGGQLGLLASLLPGGHSSNSLLAQVQQELFDKSFNLLI
ncbi:hypothetical protein QVM41_02175 [Pseudomonas shirazica]